MLLSCSAISTSTQSRGLCGQTPGGGGNRSRSNSTAVRGDGLPPARDRPGPAPPARRAGRRAAWGLARSRTCSTPSRSASTSSHAGQVHGPAAVGGLQAADTGIGRERDCHDEAASRRSIRPGPRRARHSRGHGDLVGGASDWAFGAPGQDFDARSVRPGTACGGKPPLQLFGRVRFGQLHFHHFVDSLRSPPPGPGETHPRFRMKPLAETQASPARRNNRSEHRIRSRCPISRRSPCLEKRIRTRNRTMGPNFPATAVGGETDKRFLHSRGPGPRERLSSKPERQYNCRLNQRPERLTRPSPARVSSLLLEITLHVAGILHRQGVRRPPRTRRWSRCGRCS